MKKTKTHPVEGFAEVNFNEEPFLTDFKKIYEAMHTSGCPYAHSAAGDHYAVGAHGEIMDMLKQHDIWKSKYGPALNYLESPGVLVSVDPPEHDFEARIVSSSFSKEAFAAMVPEMRAFINERIDSVFADGQADLHELLSLPFPLLVIFKLLGIDRYDPDGTDRFTWIRQGIIDSVGMLFVSERQMQGAGLSVAEKRAQVLQRTNRLYLDQLASTKQKLDAGELKGDENLVTKFLTTPGADGSFLTDEKIIGFVSFLMTAGS
ncbi:MAG: hypothetical protein ACR2PJ_04685, partial [Pseudomonadales bacterium]